MLCWHFSFETRDCNGDQIVFGGDGGFVGGGLTKSWYTKYFTDPTSVHRIQENYINIHKHYKQFMNCISVSRTARDLRRKMFSVLNSML